MNLEDPYTLFRAAPTDFKKQVMDALVKSGFDTTVDYCADMRGGAHRFFCLKQALYYPVQKNVVVKANLTNAKTPRITLHLYWCLSDWSGNLRVYSRFLEDFDVETSRKGWEYRLERHLKVLSEVAEDKQTNNPKCGKCGGLMIEKEMKHVKTSYEKTDVTTVGPLALVRGTEIKHPHYGEWFWGCLRYPDCRGMKAYWIPEDQDPDIGNIMKDIECPKCANPMVIRLARRGVNAGKKFLGCVQYPVCKGTLTREEALALVLMRR